MRIVLLVILLGFPAVDIFVTVRFAEWIGVPAWIWFLGGAIAGWSLLSNVRMTFRAKSHAALSGRAPLLSSLLDSGRKVLAGVLFLLPGIITDCAARLLLALPINLATRLQPQMSAGGEVLDGEYRRLD